MVNMAKFTMPTEDNHLDQVQREIENTRKRLQYVGYGEEAKPERGESALTKAVDFLLRFERGGAGTLSEFISPSLGETPQQFDPLAAFKRGFTGEEDITPRDIAVHYGLSEEPLFEVGGDKFRFSPSPAGIAGFLGTVLNPFDPVNWLTFGVGGAAKGAVKGTQVLETAFGKEAAEQIGGLLGGRMRGAHGENVGELVNNLLKQAREDLRVGKLTTENYENLRNLLEASAKSTTAKKRLPIADRYITAQLQVPIVNARIAEAAIPGSKPIVTGVSRLGRRFASTPMGESLSKAFSTKFISPRHTREVYRHLRGLEGTPVSPSMQRELEHLTPEEAGEQLWNIMRESGDVAREQVSQGARIWEEILKGMPEDRRTLLTYELSPAGRLTPLLEMNDLKSIKNLGFSDQEVLAAVEYHKMRKSIANWFNAREIPFGERYSWVPHIFKHPPTSAEAGVLKLEFGDIVPKFGDTLDDDLFNLAVKNYPFLKERVLTSGALAPHEVNRTLEKYGLKPLLSEDLYHIASTVDENFTRAKAAVEATEKIRNQFGLTADEMRATGMTFLPDGYGLYKLKTEPQTGRTTFERALPKEDEQFFEELATGRKQKSEVKDVFALPDDMVRAWDDYTKLHYSRHERNALLRFIDKATSEFRTLAYMVTPGHIPRDFVSNLYNLWLMGVRNLKDLPVALKLAHHMESDLIFPTETMKVLPNKNWTYLVNRNGKLVPTSTLSSSDEVMAFARKKNAGSVAKLLSKKAVTVDGEDLRYIDVMQQASKRGVLDTGWWSVEGPETGALKLATGTEKLKQWFTTLDPMKHPWTQGMVSLTKLADNSTRLFGFLHNLRQGDELGTAASKIKTYLFDYSDLTPFEMQWMRRLVPFYTWMRKNIPLQIKEAFRTPGKLATVGKYHRELSEEYEPGEVPSFLKDASSILLPGGKLFVTSPLPYQDLSRLPYRWDMFSEQLSNVNPLFRVIPELALNRQFFSGLPIEHYRGEPTEGSLGRLGIPFVSQKRGLDYLLEQIPLYRNVSTMTPLFYTGGEGGGTAEERAFARMLSFVGGPSVFGTERAREIAAYEERDRLRALIKLLRDMGIEVPNVRDMPY